ncbi:PREDICTED: uncharacterized protein LOC104810950 [Tarenaya hassleriana]|uniref:uncharacterized protein LOC104810950 n=1 Tax=Tarenaya hassleriana TaxID=28532 RepID=UPI00053C1E69|nr:PREDICTED: uncharacterized protein LOC104810950 [Tarenaya hassleriana]
MVTISNEKQESRISGTYIRTLVKQLASSRTKDSDSAMNPREKTTENSKKSTGKTHMQPQTQKKQVRRRLHTSRPYQERLLNMAEARREIVTALKQHRAAMKQRQRQQTQTQTQTLLLSEGESRPRPSSECVMDPFPYCVHPPPPPQPPDPFPWQIPTTNPPLNFVLPNQPLGLNLNFQDFNDIIQTSPSSSSSICTNNSNSVSINNNPPIFSSPPSSSPPPPSSSSTAAVAGGGGGDAGFHQTVDEEEMARMRSIGEKHQIEWNDTVNLVTSAWWFEFMKTVEPPEMKPEIDDDVCRPFGDVMEFPSWLNPTEEPYLSDYSSPDDPALSCMEIGEIEGMDGDWLA